MGKASFALIFCLTFITLARVQGLAAAEEYDPRFEACFQMYKSAYAFAKALEEPAPVLRAIKSKGADDKTKTTAAELLRDSVVGWLKFIHLLGSKGRTWAGVIDVVGEREEWLKGLMNRVDGLVSIDSASQVLKHWKDSQRSLELLASQVKVKTKGHEEPDKGFADTVNCVTEGISLRAFPFSQPDQ